MAATTVLTSCIPRAEVVEAPSPTTSPSDDATPSPTPTPEAPTVGHAALASDPAAVALATVLARQDGQEPIVVAGVLTPDQRAAIRQLDDLVVVSTDPVSGARLQRSADASVPTRVRHYDDLVAALATMVRAAFAMGDPDQPMPTVHLVTSSSPEAVAATAADLPAGDLLLAIDGDPRAPGPAHDALRAALADGANVVVPDGSDLGWKLDVVGNGLRAPGGGQLLSGKRFLAAYGSPGSASLGILGEQGVAATHERILRIAAEGYDDGALPIVPTFEIIAAVASASATADGDYSYGISHDLIREWVDYAAENDLLVVLDIQPGRTDFLTHVKQYEEFLRQPHVGVALDPEWRLKQNQVHLRQIGTVDAAEVNTVVDWLAALVREHDLPQKMLVLHQFRASMITNKDVIRAPDELFVVLHFDGQGGQPAKESGYFAYAVGDDRFTPGWKNFYDEDRPMAGPTRVLGFDPQPRFISFQ